jgi:C-terminal processing protease CtpA/Prc
MHTIKTICSLGFVVFMSLMSSAQQKTYTTQQYKDDFEFLWKTINDQYCYFNKKQTDWENVRRIYTPMVDTVKSRSAFVGIIEKVLYELYDHHCGLNTNTDVSRRLVPTGTDLWAEYVDGKPIIIEVRKGSGAESVGMKAGMQIIAINNVPVEEAVAAFLPKSLKHGDPEANNFALRLALAGNHIDARKFATKAGAISKDFSPDQQGMLLDHIAYKGMVDTKKYGNIGYIRINNCLFDDGLVHIFDSVMLSLQNTQGLILDLRETPSGGNSSVARAILGWFINKEMFYQKHEYFAEEKETGIKRSWVEIVSPRVNKYYSKPLVVLVNHWTGSIAEAITIGFQAFHRPNTTIIGTEMARLNGAVYSFQMPNTGIGFSLTAERLYTVDGQPRENFTPPVTVDVRKTSAATDPFINAGIQRIQKQAGKL